MSGLILENVEKHYGSACAVKDVNLHLPEGKLVCFLGPSGCGKTTLLKIMLGLLTPTEGEILVMGRPLSAIGLRAWRDCLGAVMQDDQLFAGTIADGVEMMIELTAAAWCGNQARRLPPRAAWPGFAGGGVHYPAVELSWRRVAFCCPLSAEPWSRCGVKCRKISGMSDK